MQAEDLKVRYYGSLAETYDAEREQTPLWHRENAVVRALLTEARPRTVLDVPVGTGRFLELYRELGITATGVDVSTEMLGHASEKAERVGASVTLQQGDIRELPFTRDAFDVAVCVRFLNWVSADDVRAAVRELARVAPVVIFGLQSFAPLSTLDVRSRDSILEHLFQLKRRFYNWRTRAQFIHHEPATVQAVTAEGLRLDRKERIQTKRRGFDYSIYMGGR